MTYTHRTVQGAKECSGGGRDIRWCPDNGTKSLVTFLLLPQGSDDEGNITTMEEVKNMSNYTISHSPASPPPSGQKLWQLPNSHTHVSVPLPSRQLNDPASLLLLEITSLILFAGWTQERDKLNSPVVRPFLAINLSLDLVRISDNRTNYEMVLDCPRGGFCGRGSKGCRHDFGL